MSIRTAMEEEDGLAGEIVSTVSYGEITGTYSKANAAMHGLVWLMSSPSINDSAKASAAAAVAALAADGNDNKDRIARTDGAVEALIRLAVEGGDKSRACAAMAMANLVEDHVENKLLLASAPPFLPAATALLRTGSEKARWHAARLLASVAMMPELRESIGAEKGALDELVRLCRSGGEDATCSAACALANLTDAHEANWERMANVQKGFSTLIAVAGGGSVEGRSHAVRALANLAVPHANKTLIAKTPRALRVLVEALEMDRGATQSNAAAAIGNLAHDHTDNKDRIAQEPSSLNALVSSLRNGSDDCRRNSAAALANFCHEHAENIELLMRTPDSLEALVWCLWESRDDCRNNAACCIANLAASSMKNQGAIASVAKSIDALVDCCRRGGAFTVANATGALANLAERHTTNKRLIGDTDNAIATLVKVACTGKLPSAVSNAACALANLAADDRRNKRAIAASPGALQILVQLVAASPPDTQSNAACALANLVADEDDTKSALAEVPYAFGGLVELLRTGTDSGKVNACRALANAVSWHDDNKAQVATVRGSIAALVALIVEEGPLNPLHTAAALALANMTDAHLKNSRTTALEEGGLEALVRIAGHAEEEGRVHAVRCLANLSEPYDNRELIGATEGSLETLLLALGSSNDTLCTTAAFTLAKLTESVAANVVALADTFNAVPKLTECVARGSRRARSNAAVCVCHLTARRHGNSVLVARSPGAVRALADAASAEIPVHVDSQELEFEDGAYAAGVSREQLERFVTSEQVVEEREQGRSTDDTEAHEDAKRCSAFAIASLGANKGPDYQHIKPVTKIKGVLPALVWILTNSSADPNGLRLIDAQGNGIPPIDSANGVPTEDLPPRGAQGDITDITSRDGMSAQVLPRVNAAAALANLADDDSGNIVSIIRTQGAIEALVAAVRQEEWEHLRYHAARALANLSTFYGARTAIAESPGALATLVAVLETKQDPAKIQVARALGNLAANHLLNKGRIANTPKSIVLLVRAITFGSFECRAQAARALGEVCENHTPNAIAVESTRGSLDGAIMMITEGLRQVKDEERRWDPAVEEEARRLPHPEASQNPLIADDFSVRRDTLDAEPWMLVETCYLITHVAVTDSLRNAVGQRPGALELLVRGAQVRLEVARTNAVKALAALACNCEAVSKEICNVDGALNTLLGICDEPPEQRDDVRSAAVKTLVNLVDAFLESKELICQIPHALHAVVNVISTGTDGAKGNACYLLANLLELRYVDQRDMPSRAQYFE